MSTVKKINYILSPEQKKNFYILLLVSSVVSFLEIVGISAILPVLIIFSDSSFIENKYIAFILDSFEFINKDNILSSAIFFLFFIYVFKTLAAVVLNVIKYRILFGYYEKISRRLMKNYLNLTYSDFIKLKVFEKTNIIKTEVEYLVMGVIEPFLIIFFEGLAILFIATFLLFYNPELTIKIILILIPIVTFLLHYFGKKLKLRGHERHILNNELQKQINQGLHGIKDIKLSQKEDIYLNKFSGITSSMSSVMASIYSWQMIPRHLLELLTIITFIAICLVGMQSEIVFSELVVTLGLFAAAAFRVMPSLNRIMVSYNSIRQIKKVADVIYDDLKLEKKDGSLYQEKINNSKVVDKIEEIEIENLSFKFPENKNLIIENLNLKISRGSYIGIFGKSGTGKTTFVDLFSGLLTPTNGIIKFNKKDILKNKNLWRKHISYVPQSIYLNNESIRENIAFGQEQDDIKNKKVIESLKSAQLLDFVNSLPDGIDTIVGENGKNLSGGQIQRLGIARALYRDSTILIFDESTNSLDDETEKEFMDIVSKLKEDRIILFISHKISILRKCDIVYELNNKLLKKQNINN